MMSLIGGGFSAIANVVHGLSMVKEALARRESQDGIILNQDWLSAIDRDLNILEEICSSLDLDAAGYSVGYCKDVLWRGHTSRSGEYILPKNNAERLENALDDIRINFLVQIDSRIVFITNSRHTKYMTNDDPPFGRIVDDVFPTASEEIWEAANCLALSRPTACVFHLMRAMELAVQRLANRLDITKVEREWGKLLSDISKAIEPMPKGAARDEWSAAHSHLYHVKQAWRNDTMHPKKTYTDDQAEAVFEAVKSFMVHLSPLVAEH
jgi:HEPN domain-containing protein